MKPFILVVILLIIVLLLIKEYFIVGTSFIVIERILHWSNYIDGVVIRMDGWRSLIDTGLQYFFTGVGKGGLHHIFEEAHNNYIKLLFESGIFGLISFAWLLVAIGLLCVKLYRNGHDAIDKVIGGATLCCLVAISIAAIVQDAFKPVLINSMLWIFIGITGAVDGISRGDL